MGAAIRSAGAVSLALLLAFALGAAGCGGSDDPAYCADRAALEQSLSDVVDVDVAAEGLDVLRQRLRAVQRDANALVDSAREEFAPEASALRSAIAQLERSARDAAADPSAARVADLTSDASAVAAAFGELSDAIGTSC